MTDNRTLIVLIAMRVAEAELALEGESRRTQIQAAIYQWDAHVHTLDLQAMYDAPLHDLLNAVYGILQHSDSGYRDQEFVPEFALRGEAGKLVGPRNLPWER